MTREEAIALTESPCPDKMRLIPMRNRVLCLMVQADSQKGHIIIPEGARVITGEAIVVAKGPGVFDVASGKWSGIPDYEVGDRVQLAKYMGVNVANDEDVEVDDPVLGKFTKNVRREWVLIEPQLIIGKYEPGVAETVG